MLQEKEELVNSYLDNLNKVRATKKIALVYFIIERLIIS